MSAGRPLLEDVAALAFPRFPGTEAERRAADFVEERFRGGGLETTREPFRASPAAVRRLRLVAHGTVAAGAWTLALVAPAPAVSLVLGLALLAALPLFSRWRPGIERAFDREPQLESANVVGRRCGDGPAVVFLAHVDSKSAALPTAVPVVVILATMLTILAATLVAGLRLAGIAAPPIPPALLFATSAALLLVPFIPVGNRSPGAMDNASGVAVLLELARTLPRDADLAGADLRFVATGAEEIGLCGAMRWAQAHAAELDRARTVVVNLDSVGVGAGVLAVDVHGRLGGSPMAELVDRAGRAAGVTLRRLPFLPGVGVDSMPFAARGFATVSLLGEVLGAPSRRIHGPRDTLDLLSEAGLDAAARAARAIACEGVRGAGLSSGAGRETRRAP